MRLSEKEMGKMVFLTVIMSFSVVSIVFAYEPGEVIWEDYYGGYGFECAQDVLWLESGGIPGEGTFVMVGTTAPPSGELQLFIGKFKAQNFGGPWGIWPLWERTYGGSGDDYAYSVELTSDGAFIVTGYKNGDVWLLKIDEASGDTLWTRTYGGAGFDGAECVQQTSDGGYIIVGYTSSYGSGSFDVYLIKTDSIGNMLWQKWWGGPNEEYAYEVRETPDNGYIIAAITHSFGHGECDAWLIKTDANGDTLWTKIYGVGNWDRVRSVELTPDGGYIFAGWTGDSPVGDGWVIKTDSNGDILWMKTYGGQDGGYITSVRPTWDGGYIMCGGIKLYGHGDQDIWLIKTDANGDTLWTRDYGTTDNTDRGNSVRQTFDGGYIAVGEGIDWPHGYQMAVYRVAGAQTPYVKVLSPNGGEEFVVGDTCNITWFAADNVGVDSISILYSIHAGATWDTIATGEPNDSLYEWIIPYTPSDSCLVKILAYDPGINIGEDQSDSCFSIAPSGIEENISMPKSFVFQVSPNPFTELVKISLVGVSGNRSIGEPEIRIYDVSGRLVKRFTINDLRLTDVTWNGQDDNGKVLPSGIYYCRLSQGSLTQTKKILLVK